MCNDLFFFSIYWNLSDHSSHLTPVGLGLGSGLGREAPGKDTVLAVIQQSSLSDALLLPELH